LLDRTGSSTWIRSRDERVGWARRRIWRFSK
jgi:hypothetical protein